MASYAYPPAAPTLSGDVESISRFLQSPTVIARRLRTLVEQRFISDTLLSGRFQVSGGAILYETGESIYSDDAAQGVAPGSEYPLTTVSSGTASIANVVKWGQDTLVTDEAIKRRQLDPVNRALTKLSNQIVKTVDSVALAAISSAVTNSAAAGTAWATATGAAMLTDVLQAAAYIRSLNQGYNPDTVVVDDFRFARAIAAFSAAGYVPRESVDNPTLNGMFPEIAGMRWLVTPNLPAASTVLVLDSTLLGGMADEDLGGPGFVQVDGVNVEVKSMRDDDDDQWRLRARRVTVPVVVEPAAAYKITSA